MRASKSIKHAIARRARSIGLLRRLRKLIPLPGDRVQFQNSAQYWKERYESGGDSGEGSYGPLARYKASFINEFCKQNEIGSAIEFGCGDGNQASMFDIDTYIGVDISEKCVEWAKENFGRTDWRFLTLDEYHRSPCQPSQIALSLDVIYHLVEDETYSDYLHDLFAASSRYVLIYASNFEHFDPTVPHVRHRKVVEDALRDRSGWQLLRTEDNPFSKRHDSDSEYGSFANFHIFEKHGG